MTTHLKICVLMLRVTESFKSEHVTNIFIPLRKRREKTTVKQLPHTLQQTKQF